MKASDALRELGGVATRRELLTKLDDLEFEAAVAARDLVRARRDTYVMADLDEARRQAIIAGGVVSHLSAALAWGWKVKRPPTAPTVTVPKHRSLSGKQVARIYYANLLPTELEDGRTSRVRTVADCARSLPFDEALSVADSALRSRKVTRAQAWAAVQAGPRTGRRRAVAVLEAASPMAANPFESVLRAIAMDVDGFEPEPQGAVGTVGHADVADLSLRIALEAESWEHHGLHEAFDYDIRRYTTMVRQGWLVARFTWDEVMHKPSYVADAIADLVKIRTRELGARPIQGR